MAKKDPILDLSTDQDHDVIIIDNQRYDIKSMSQFSLTDLYKFQAIGEAFQNFGKEELNEEQIAELEVKLHNITKTIFVDIPDEVLMKVNPFQKIEILKAFRTLPLPSPEVEEAVKKAEESGLQ